MISVEFYKIEEEYSDIHSVININISEGEL